jgi:hypothetical protein
MLRLILHSLLSSYVLLITAVGCSKLNSQEAIKEETLRGLQSGGYEIPLPRQQPQLNPSETPEGDHLSKGGRVSQEHVEAILVWSRNGPSPTVNQWLADRGLQTLPMRQGLLVSGTRQQFSTAFQVTVDLEALPISLPIPPALDDFVSSITIPRPPHYQ